MTIRYVDLANLDDVQFIGEIKSDGQLKIKVNVSKQAGNALKATDQGLAVSLTPTDPARSAVLEMVNGVQAWNTGNYRNAHWAKTRNGIMIVKLDIRRVRNHGDNLIARLPNDFPTFDGLMEDMAYNSDGTRTGVWIEANSRDIRCENMKLNHRYIFNLVGFCN